MFSYRPVRFTCLGTCVLTILWSGLIADAFTIQSGSRRDNGENQQAVGVMPTTTAATTYHARTDEERVFAMVNALRSDPLIQGRSVDGRHFLRIPSFDSQLGNTVKMHEGELLPGRHRRNTDSDGQNKLNDVNSAYIKDLFSAMLREDDEEAPSTGGNAVFRPTIRGFICSEVSREIHSRSLLTFNMSALKDVRPISRLEIVVEMKHIDVLEHEGNRTFFITFHSADNEDTETVSVFPVILENFTMFDISDFSDKMRRRILSKATNSIQFSVEDRDTDHQSLFRNAQIDLILYYDMANNPLILSSARYRRSGYNDAEVEDAADERTSPGEFFNRFSDTISESSPMPSVHCQRYRWNLNMEVFHLPWYLSPVFIRAGYCKGICSYPFTRYSNATYYSWLKNMFHYHTFLLDTRVPRATCTPATLLPQTVIYHSDEGDIPVVSRLPDARVGTCGCR